MRASPPFVHMYTTFDSLLFFSTDAGSFTMEGADSAGIVHKITSVIANHGKKSVKCIESPTKEVQRCGGIMSFE